MTKLFSATGALALTLASGALLACHQAKTPERTAAGKLPFSFTSKSIELPVSERTFQGGAVAQVANQYCLMCHSMGMITTQPPFDRKTWLTEINKMRTAYHCPVPENKVSQLADFLYQQSHRSPSWDAAGPARPATDRPATR